MIGVLFYSKGGLCVILVPTVRSNFEVQFEITIRCNCNDNGNGYVVCVIVDRNWNKTEARSMLAGRRRLAFEVH